VAAGRGRSRRVSLPGVAELFRPAAPGPVDPDGADRRRASGRERHTQKITVYLSAEELLDLERARLALLRYGAAADRGRIVREAIAVLLADLDACGQDSLLARRISRTNGVSPDGTSAARAISDPGRAGGMSDSADLAGPATVLTSSPSAGGDSSYSPSSEEASS
jgi:hypothetical protein